MLGTAGRTCTDRGADDGLPTRERRMGAQRLSYGRYLEKNRSLPSLRWVSDRRYLSWNDLYSALDTTTGLRDRVSVRQ